MAELVYVNLLQSWNGHKKGEKILVDADRAKTLVDVGIAAWSAEGSESPEPALDVNGQGSGLRVMDDPDANEAE